MTVIPSVYTYSLSIYISSITICPQVRSAISTQREQPMTLKVQGPECLQAPPPGHRRSKDRSACRPHPPVTEEARTGVPAGPTPRSQKKQGPECLQAPPLCHRRSKDRSVCRPHPPVTEEARTGVPAGPTTRSQKPQLFPRLLQDVHDGQRIFKCHLGALRQA